MDAALALVVFAPALALGSFLNVVAARLPEGRSLVKPRSACGSCGVEIAWYDNVPVFSYLSLRGRCRACGETFSLRYPAVELATAFLVAACFFHFGLTGEAVVGAYFCAALVVLSAIDAERRILPDLIVLPSFLLVLTGNLILQPDRWMEWVGASLGASLFLFLALVAYPRGMGMGDVKLALLLGAGLGYGDGFGARRLLGALRPPRGRRAQDGHPLRAVSRVRVDRGALRRPAAARRVPEPLLGHI